jgi:hypothetical protein
MSVYDLYVKAQVKPPLHSIVPSLDYYQQVELFKVLCHGRWIEIAQHPFREGEWYAGGVDYKRRTFAHSFEEAVCALILKYWSEMRDNDKERVKEILCQE